MQRLKMVVAALAAVVALSAVVSATASAALPEFLPTTSGATFSGTSGAGTLETKSKGTIECSSNTEEGTVTGAKTGTLTIDFKGCTIFGFIGAHSLGDKEGIILFKGTTELCYINKSTKDVGIVVVIPATEPVHLEVAGKLLLVKGAVIGLISPNNSNKTGPYKITFKQTKAVQEPTKCEGGSEQILLTAEGAGAFEQSGEATTAEITFAAAHELMA